ncbi:unnamed protein product [Ceutorhynchus assimilis]|uniref:Adenylate kinase 8 n=1 Tax=Ceutorhynchus assimilis TaxID=467358 RepID=A0A9N9MUB8_9CUCU|nr:unnamed protein product [Ceutorhynchus assimilis]
MSDLPKIPLRIPKNYIPYLEKHRIYELFHEMARELVIQKPEDHILFMKQILEQAAASRDVCRLILISSPKINRITIAQEIAKHTMQFVVTSNDLKNLFSHEMSADTVAKTLTVLLRNQNVSKTGWIIADCINNEEEAKALLKLGVLPTHVFQIITPFEPKLDELLYCDVAENWPQVRRDLFGLKEVFGKKIKEISLMDKNIVQLARTCHDLCFKKSALKTVKPRVIILGPRGSGKKTQARLLANLIHVDFEYLLCQAWMSESELGQMLRQCDKMVCFHSELLCQIVNKRILEPDCMDQGWVLTGYPYTVTDLKFLDSLQTPPNRIIALDCDLNIAKERIRNRPHYAYKGSNVDLKSTANEEKKAVIVSDRKHPKDSMDIVQAEHDFYCNNYGRIKAYCGETLMIVKADQSERRVYECILGYIVGANPMGPPRKGFGVEIPEVCSCDCINIPPKVMKAYHLPV